MLCYASSNEFKQGMVFNRNSLICYPDSSFVSASQHGDVPCGEEDLHSAVCLKTREPMYTLALHGIA
jgi:hypothetical protein